MNEYLVYKMFVVYFAMLSVSRLVEWLRKDEQERIWKDV
jgi:hypothetical protein